MPTAPKSCVLIADRGGVVRYATFSACRLLGLADYEAANLTVDEVAQKLNAKFSWGDIRARVRGGVNLELDAAFVSPVGYRGHLHLHAHPVFDLSEQFSSIVVVLEVLPKDHFELNSRPSFDFAGRYATTSLSYERGREIFLRMDRLVRSEDLFRKSRLTVGGLAQKLNTNTQYLSHVINYFCNERFPNYINRLRIQWMAAQQLQSRLPEQSAPWKEAGFGSYSAYHRALKQLRSVAVEAQ